MNEVLIEVTRGDLAENLIRGAIAVIDEHGLVASAGEPEYFTYMRSAAKPVQATVAIECGAADAFHLNQQELAIMCGSHIGSDEHCRVLGGILEKVGLQERDLDLYEDLSLSEKLREERIAAHVKPRRIFNNCSGKHACMLAICRHMGWDTEGYYLISHPVQQRILDNIADFTGYPRERIVIGLDGCGVPVFAMPLPAMARAYLNLVHPELFPDDRHAASSARIVDAMATYPEMLFGNGFIATELTRVTKGRIIGKIGADGIFCLALRHEKLAAAVKIEDGSVPHVSVAVMHLLHELQLLTKAEEQALEEFAVFRNINCHGVLAGTTRAVFSLHHPG